VEINQHAKAVEDLTKVIELDPRNANGYYWRSRAYEGLGEKAKAESDTKKFQRLNP
jgi:tetratricopeptide (TPR) repeat protein